MLPSSSALSVCMHAHAVLGVDVSAKAAMCACKRSPSRRMQMLAQHIAKKACTATNESAAQAGPIEAQSTAPHPGRILTDDEKRSLYHNGFVIIREVIRKDVVQRIHDEIENSPTNPNGRHAAYALRRVCFAELARAAVPVLLTEHAALGW